MLNFVLNLSVFKTIDGIKDLKDVPHWTITHKEPKDKALHPQFDKAPLDLNILMREGRPSPARWKDGQRQWTIDEIENDFGLRLTPNLAFLLDTLRDNYVLLDIEPSCDETLKQKFVNSDWVYGETSLSGKGIHLLFKIPKNFEDYPVAMKKTVLRAKDGTYEMHLNHWVTFTGNQIEKPKIIETNIEEIFKDLATLAQETEVREMHYESESLLKPKDIPMYDELFRLLTAIPIPFEPEKHDNDISGTECSIIGRIQNSVLEKLTESPSFATNYYTEEQAIALIYYVAKHHIPHREKHDSLRNKMPWLLYTIIQQYAKKPNDNTPKRFLKYFDMKEILRKNSETLKKTKERQVHEEITNN